MRDVGIEADWQIIIGREEFFNATKLMHNALQGNPLDLSPSEWKVYEEYNEINAGYLTDGWDVVIVHDPQPLFVREHVPDKSRHWIWRCHIDLLSPKNMALSPEDAAFVCDQFGIDVDRPLMCQVSRFDPWKDPLGVIDAYRQVNEEIPEVQLALVG